jgi:hypothetical protein
MNPPDSIPGREDPADRELERLLAAMPLCRPSAALDRRIAASRPRHAHPLRHRVALAAMLALLLSAGATAVAVRHAAAPADAMATGGGATAAAAAEAGGDPQPPTQRDQRWAHARDEGIVVLDGHPMRLWRTRTVLRRDHVDPATHTRITCIVPCDSVQLVSQETM